MPFGIQDTLSLESHLKDTLQVTVTEELLGKGSYGVVIIAEWMGVKVAAKRVHDILLPDDLETNTVKKKAEDEAKLLQDLRHPNLIQCFGRYYDDRGRLCIVMELMHQSLADLLKQTTGPLSSEKVNDIGSEISSALRYLHSMNVSHRDITPNNILLTASGRAKLSDLGGAKHILHVHSPIYATRQPGTPIYMPPEALDGSKYAPCLVDVYSLGVVVLEMSSGENPKPVPQNPYRPCDVSSYNGTQTFYRVPEEERRSKCFEKIDVANPIRAIVLECLRDNPRERPSAIQMQKWFLQMKNNQIHTIHRRVHQTDYDDTVMNKGGAASLSQKDHSYVNLLESTPPLPPRPNKARLVTNEIPSDERPRESATKIPEAATFKQDDNKYQALYPPKTQSGTTNECTYQPLYVDGTDSETLQDDEPSKCQIQRGGKTYYGPHQSRQPIRDRANTAQPKPSVMSTQKNTSDNYAQQKPQQVFQQDSPAKLPQQIPPKKPLKEIQNENPPADTYVSMAPDPFKPPLPPRVILKSKPEGTLEDLNPPKLRQNAEEDLDVKHVYESLDGQTQDQGKALSMSVLRATKNLKRAAFRSKRTSSLHTSENELLITDDKDAGSKLLVHNTKGESGEVHENQVTTVDPVDVHHVQGSPQGILHRILTSNKRQSLQTGIRAGKIQIMHTGLSHGSTDTLLNIGSNEIVATEANRNPYFQFDLSKNRLVQLEGYRLQCSGLGTYGRPQEWEVHVSLDGKTWMSVAHDIWENDSQTTCYWCCNSQSPAIGRFVKIIQIGQNKKGNNKFCLSGIEFYGKLYSSVAEEIKSE